MTLRYFTDRDLGKQFPAILRDAGLDVERHLDLFEQDGTDEEWLEYCGKNGRVAITHNHRIRYTPNELAAVVEFDVRLLIAIGDAPYPELARNFVNTLGRIESFLATHKAPLIAKVYRPTPQELAKNPQAGGQVQLWYPSKPAPH